MLSVKLVFQLRSVMLQLTLKYVSPGRFITESVIVHSLLLLDSVMSALLVPTIHIAVPQLPMTVHVVEMES